MGAAEAVDGEGEEGGHEEGGECAVPEEMLGEVLFEGVPTVFWLS